MPHAHRLCRDGRVIGLLALVGVVMFMSWAGASRIADTPMPKPVPRHVPAPIVFEENGGQADPEAKFIARGRNYTLFLTAADAVLARGADSIRLTFPGSLAQPRLVAVDRMPGVVNYLLGAPSQWRTGIPTYAKVRYEELYPGIDLVFYGNDGQLEFDLLVEPGADPRVIRLDLAGTRKLAIAEDGALVARTGTSELRMHPPVVYQVSETDQRTPIAVAGRYRLVGEQRVTFDVDEYDRTRPLVIDPVVVYATYLGGDATDDVGWFSGSTMMAVDASGAAYVTGLTDSSNFPTTSGALHTQHIVKFSETGDGNAPCTDPVVTPAYLGSYAFVTKLAPDGASLLYSTYLGGTHQVVGGRCHGPVNYATGIGIDTSGRAYVTGFSDTADFPLSADGHAGIFVTKLNASGSGVLYTTRVPQGSFISFTESRAIAVGADGSAYVTGRTNDFAFPATTGAFQTACRACTFSVVTPGADAFVLKLGPSGAVSYATYLGGSGASRGVGIAVDGLGQAVVIGSTNTSAGALFPFPTTLGSGPGADAGLLGGSDVFVTKLNAAGSALVFSALLNGDQPDIPGGVATDATGHTYATGGTSSGEFPTTNGSFEPTFGGGSQAFVTKLGPSGSLVYSTYLGPAEGAVDVAVDGAGRAFVTGSTGAALFPTTADRLEDADQNFPGQPSIFLSVFNASGSALDYSTYLGGQSGILSQSIAVNPTDGSVYIVGAGGASSCCTYPTTAGAFRETPPGPLDGSKDVVVTRIRLGTIQPPSCSGAAPSATQLWPPDHRMVTIGVLGVTDPQGQTVTLNVTGIQQDEPTNGLGDGDTPIDGAGVNTPHASVRAERSGKGNGRVYVIAFSATNTDGASCTGAVHVGVPHSQKPGLAIVDSGVRYDSTVAGGPPLP